MEITRWKTPYYLVHRKKFEENCMEVEDSFKKLWGSKFICGYSFKTNYCQELIKVVQNRGWFAEVVSADEFVYAKSMGFGNGKMICNGPVKGVMLRSALEQYQIINVDSLQEVEEICKIIEEKTFCKEKLVIGLRVNFNLEKLCPGETTAGNDVSRFGISYENGDFGKAILYLQKSKISISGIHMHTSTSSRSLNVFRELSKMACRLEKEFGLTLKYVDIGGGFFGGQIVDGKPLMSEYAKVITDELKKQFDPKIVTLIVEPGASIIATAIDYVTRVVNIRSILEERIITLDGTLLHINPFMAIRKPVLEIDKTGDEEVDIQHLCGCTCMEKDRFDVLYHFRELLQDSKVIFHNVGAYTMSLNSSFIVKPPEIYVTEL